MIKDKAAYSSDGIMGRFLFSSALAFCLVLSSLTVSADKHLLLYQYPYSFYSQKASIALYEKKLDFDKQDIDITKDENYKPWFLEINPRGEVPVLKHVAKIIPDSGRIIDYIEEKFTDDKHPSLVPEDPTLRDKTNRFREMIERINGNTVTTGTFYHPEVARDQKMPFIESVRKSMKENYEKVGDKLKKVANENPKYKDVLLSKVEQYEKTKALISNKESFTKLLDQVNEALTAVENELKSHTDKNSWLVSNNFTVADVVLTVLLERLNLVGLAHRFWENGLKPEVSSYYQRVQKRDSYKQTMPGTFTHVKTFISKIFWW